MESPAFRRLDRAVKRGSLEPDIRVLREAQEDERQMDEAIKLEKNRKNEKIHGPVKSYITGVAENESDRDQRDTPPHPYLDAARNREALRGQQQLMPFFQRMFRAPEEVDAIFKESQQARPFANGGLKAYRSIPPAAAAASAAGRLPESRWMPADPDRSGPAGQDPEGEILKRHSSVFLDLAESGLEFDRRQLANMLFYETVTGSRVEDPQAWPAQRTAYAKARLAWRGKPGETITEDALYDLTGKRLQEEDADRAESLRLERQGKIAALKGQGYEEARSHLSGVSGAGFEPALKQGYLKVQMEYGPEELHAVRPLYDAFSEALRVRHARDFKGGPDMLDALTAFAKTDQAGRQRIITGIAVLAREDRIEITDFFQRVGNAFDDGILDIHLGLSANRMRRNRAALDQLLDEGVLPAGIQPGGVPELSGILAREGPGDWAGRYDQLANARMEVIPNVGPRYRPGDLQRAMTAEERRTLEEQRDQLDGLSKFFGDIGVSGIRIKHDADTLEHTGLLDTLGDTAVMMGGSLPEMGMAAAPGGVLLPALFTSHFERHLAGLRADNPDLPEARLAPTAFASALTYTALSRAEILFVGGKLPGLRGALAKLGAAEGKIGALAARAAAAGEKLAASGLRGKALAGGARFAGRSTAATGTELLQNVTPDVWQSITHALHREIRGADWDTVMARERAALGDTVLLSMGFVVVFGTGRRALDYIGEGDLRTLLTDRRGLQEQGLSPADVEIVVEKAQRSPAEAAELAKQAVDTTPVEERREQILILQEQMEQEQMMGQTAMNDGNPADPGDFTIPADSDPQFEDLGDPGDPGAVWADAIKLQQLIDQTQAAGRFNIFDEGAESLVYPLGKNWVLKKVNGLMDNTLPRWANVRHDKEALVDRVETIRALDGLKTYAALASGGELLIVQERGTPITPEDYKSIVLKEKGDPAKQGKFIVTIRGRRFLVSDLHDGNFLKDKNGVIRVSDLLSGEIKNAGNTLWNAGQTPPDLDSKSK